MIEQPGPPETAEKRRARELLWAIWERCASDFVSHVGKQHPEVLVRFYIDFLIDNADLASELEASVSSVGRPSMEVLQQLEQRALPKWIRERFLSDSLRMPNSRWGDCLPTSSRTPIQVGEVLQSKGRTSTSATLLKGSVRLKTGQLGCVLCGTLLLQAGPSTRAEPLLRAQNTCEQ